MMANQAAAAPWGFPERIPYQGSVEHVRLQAQQYIPVVPLNNARTLLKAFPAAALPGLAPDRIREYAEPIFSVPKYEDAKPTGQFNKPVKVLAWDSKSPPIELALGVLEPGTYVVRLIAATPAEHVERMSKRLVVNFEVNDGLAGEVNQYRKRCAAIEEFYSIVEFFFHAPESRAYSVRLSIDPSTVLPVVFLHTIDLHDKLAQVARRAGKKTASFYDPERRLAEWKEKGTFKSDTRPPELRLADDAALWNAAMPVNAQPMGGGDGQAGWLTLASGASCLVPPGVQDDGMGIDFYGKDLPWNRPAAELAVLLNPSNKLAGVVKASLAVAMANPGLTRLTAYPAASRLEQTYRQPFSAIQLAKLYHETGDEVKARQAAVCLARLGLQNVSHGFRQTMRVYDMIPATVHGDAAFRRRYKEMYYDSRGAFDSEESCFVNSYDYLFPYIKDNEELAASLRRFIPWIKTAADARRFYETTILQYYAHQIMTYNAYLNNPTPGWMANVMAVQQDPSITKPWAEWLFRYAWVYPNRPMGVDEIAVNAITRDGTNKKGSTYYTWGGSELSTVLESLDLCRKAGLELPVDMSDRNRFPKAYWGKRFKYDMTVAGGYAFYIGDVSGPGRQRLQDLGLGLRMTPDAIPNNPSRVLSAWGGILESGREQADFRLRRAMALRVGTGYGHEHDDSFDLQLWARGVPMCGDSGARVGYAVPNTSWLGNHNTVVSDVPAGRHQWVSSFAPMEGAQYMKASLKCAGLYERQVALVDADATNSYVVDVFRVKGGSAPSYAFHGMPADQVEVNATNKHKADLEKFLPEETKWSGTCPEILTATWRMRRDPGLVTWTDKAGDKAELTVPGTERMAMGPDFSEQEPRKFVRLYLAGHEGDEAYSGQMVARQGSPHVMDNVYIKPRDWKGETVFAAVYEPFAGEGFVQSVRLLAPSGSLTNALATVAVEVTLKNGRRDVICMAPRDVAATTIGDVTIEGEFGYASLDAQGLRQAALAGGTRLGIGDQLLETGKAAYTGVIKSIDYGKRTAVLSEPLPPAASNAVIETGCPAYPTSYTLSGADGKNVAFLKGMDLAMTRVVEFATNGVPVLQSAITVIPGLTVTDDSGKFIWNFSPAANGGRPELVGTPAAAEVLKPGDGVHVWEIGPGDAYRLPVQVNAIRQAAGGYRVEANAKASFSAKP
jgi:hypothetical protein